MTRVQHMMHVCGDPLSCALHMMHWTVKGLKASLRYVFSFVTYYKDHFFYDQDFAFIDGKNS